MKCPHCGEEISFKGLKSAADRVIEEYYRSRAAGGKVTLKQLAAHYEYNYSYLSQVKSIYDRRGGWGSKQSKINGQK